MNTTMTTEYTAADFMINVEPRRPIRQATPRFTRRNTGITGVAAPQTKPPQEAAVAGWSYLYPTATPETIEALVGGLECLTIVPILED